MYIKTYARIHRSVYTQTILNAKIDTKISTKLVNESFQTVYRQMLNAATAKD